LIAQPPRADHRADRRYARHFRNITAAATPVGLFAPLALTAIGRTFTPLGSCMFFIFGEQGEGARDPADLFAEPAQLRRRILLGLGQTEQAEERASEAMRVGAGRGNIRMAPCTMLLT